MKAYFVLIDGNKLGPYTLFQLRSMWASGSINWRTHLQSEDDKVIEAGAIVRELEGDLDDDSIGAKLVGFVGFLLGLALAFYGAMEFLGAKTAMIQTTSAVLFVGGTLLIVVSSMGIALLQKR
jgi:hypothetical protein